MDFANRGRFIQRSQSRIDGDIVLVKNEDSGTGEREYHTIVLGVTVNPVQPTATKAVSLARAELPKIREQIEATRREVEALKRPIPEMEQASHVN